MIERKIGEKFSFGMKTVECVKATSFCRSNGQKCIFLVYQDEKVSCSRIARDLKTVGHCNFNLREDKQVTCFVEVKEN